MSTFKYTGIDDFHRKLFKSEKTGVVYVDVDGELHTRNISQGFAEPGFPIGVKTPEGGDSE